MSEEWLAQWSTLALVALLVAAVLYAGRLVQRVVALEQGQTDVKAGLTVARGRRKLHQEQWSRFTDRVVEVVSRERENVVFLLWGEVARGKVRLVDERKHEVLKAAHPSSHSAAKGFFGCRHFSLANKYLRHHRIDPIDWLKVD